MGLEVGKAHVLKGNVANVHICAVVAALRMFPVRTPRVGLYRCLHYYRPALT